MIVYIVQYETFVHECFLRGGMVLLVVKETKPMDAEMKAASVLLTTLYTETLPRVKVSARDQLAADLRDAPLSLCLELYIRVIFDLAYHENLKTRALFTQMKYGSADFDQFCRESEQLVGFIKWLEQMQFGLMSKSSVDLTRVMKESNSISHEIALSNKRKSNRLGFFLMIPNIISFIEAGLGISPEFDLKEQTLRMKEEILRDPRKFILKLAPICNMLSTLADKQKEQDIYSELDKVIRETMNVLNLHESESSTVICTFLIRDRLFESKGVLSLVRDEAIVSDAGEMTEDDDSTLGVSLSSCSLTSLI